MHTKHDLKVHLVWIPKYRKKILIGLVAVHARDLIRQVGMENHITMVSGKVLRDHIHIFISYHLQRKEEFAERDYDKLPLDL